MFLPLVRPRVKPLATAILLTIWTSSLPAQIVRDDFDVYHDYTMGSVPAGGIWDGIHNPTYGGDALTPAIFVADGADFFGNPKPGVLFIEDLGIHPNANGDFGVGWESDKNNAPFLFRNVRSTNDFTAVIKINAQTAGFWSYSSILARAAGPPTGFGEGDSLDPNESFIITGSLRTDPGTPDNATILTQNIMNLVETERNEDAAGPVPGDPLGPLPLWVRLSKVGPRFTPASSLDAVNWIEGTTMLSPELDQPGKMLEVGVSFMMYINPDRIGETEIDYFEIHIIPEPSAGYLLICGLASLAYRQKRG